MRTHTILEMTPAAKIDLFSALTNPCDLARLTTLLLLLIALLAKVAVSFISRYLVDVVLKTAFFATNLHFLVVH